MSTSVSDKVKPAEATKVRIKDKGEVLELAYDGAICHHPGSLWFGTAVGFCAYASSASITSAASLAEAKRSAAAHA